MGDAIKILETEIENEKKYIGGEYYHEMYIGSHATERLAKRQINLYRKILQTLENEKSAEANASEGEKDI